MLYFAAHHDHATHASMTPPPHARGGPRPRILCIDDDGVVLQLLEHAFERAGYDVKTTTTTIGAAYAFQANEVPNLVVLDVNLAGSLPIDRFCARLFNAHPAVQVVLYSANDLADLRETARRCRVQAWCPKMAGVEALLALVGRLLESPRPAGGEPLQGGDEGSSLGLDDEER
jgi:DNA-binding response OmpR family regulator